MEKQTESRDREIVLSREFNAPRELIFDVCTSPEKIGKWWGPNGFSTTTKKMNFEIAGEWIFTMHGPDGTDYPNHIIYTNIKQPELLKFDHYGNKDEDGEPHFKATVRFDQQESGTKVTMRMLFPTAKLRNEAAEFGAVEGGKQTLRHLEEYLSNVS